MRRLRAHQAATLARLECVNAAIARWDEYDAAHLMPPDLRPKIARPRLSRAELAGLAHVLIETLVELDVAWERRH